MKLCVPCQRGDHRRCRLEVLTSTPEGTDSTGIEWGSLAVVPCECPECHPLTLELEELGHR